MIIRVGFFESAQQALDLASDEDRHDPGVVRYLRAGRPVVASGAMMLDIIHPENGAVAQYAILTDGLWVWPNDLAYLVATYHLALPSTLVERISSNLGVVPEISADDMAAIIAELRGGGSG